MFIVKYSSNIVFRSRINHLKAQGRQLHVHFLGTARRMYDIKQTRVYAQSFVRIS